MIKLTLFSQAALKRLSKYHSRHPSLLFLALSFLHENSGLCLRVPEGAQIWFMIHMQVLCIDFQEGQGSELGKMTLGVKSFLAFVPVPTT